MMVLLMTVFVDLITAVAVGVVLAALAFIKQLADQQLKQISGQDTSVLVVTDEERQLLDTVENKVTIFDFGGPLSFGAAADAGHHVRERTKRDTRAIILDFARVPFIDVSAARAVETIIRDAHEAGKVVYETGLNASVRKTLVSLNSISHLSVDVSYTHRIDALRAAVDMVRAQPGPSLAAKDLKSSAA